MKKLPSFLPHLVAISIFISLSAIYFAPQFNGYSLNQSDISQFIGMSKEIVDYRQMENIDPLWTNSAFCGMPAYQISMNSTNSLSAVESFIFFNILKSPFSYLVLAMVCFYILLICFEVDPWLSIVGAIAFGFSTILILYLGGGHNTKVHAIAFIPGIIGSLVYAYRKNHRIGGLLLCVFICLHLSANHIQETYYLLFLILAIVLFELYKFYAERRLVSFMRISTFLLLSTILGIIPTTANMLLTNEYGKYTNRGKSDLTISVNQSNDNSEMKGLERNYIKEYSLGYGEVWSLAIPNVKGGAAGRLGDFKGEIDDVSPEYRSNVENTLSYWGEQYSTGGAFYFGATIFLLFVLGMVFIKDRLKWAFFASSILAVLLSWKYSPILDFFINHVPLFNKFRDTKMMLILVQLSFPLLGLLFLNDLIKAPVNKKKLFYTIGATIGIFALFYLLPSLWFNFLSTNEEMVFNKQITQYPQAFEQINQFKSEIEKIRIAIFRADVIRSIFFMILISGSIILFIQKKIKQHIFILSIGILVLIDLWMVNKRYLNNDTRSHHWVKTIDKNMPFKPTVADIEILKSEMAENSTLNKTINQKIANIPDVEFKHLNIAFSTLNFETDYRVLNLENPFISASTSYFHKSLGGYHGAKLKRYEELIVFRINKEYEMLVNALKSNNDTIINNTLRNKIPTLNMLNTKYIIYNNEYAPIKNPYANGPAWIAKEVRFVKDANEEIESLDSTNPLTTAVAEKTFKSLVPSDLKFDSSATIKQKKYSPNHLIYDTYSNQPQVAVFSEIYYKDGWNAYVDGKITNHFRVDYVLRAMTIPAGKHIVEFKFEPKTYYLSKKISYAGSVLIVLFILSVSAYEIIERNKIKVKIRKEQKPNA